MTAAHTPVLAGLLHGHGIDIERVAETGSTNADLLERARRQAPAGPVLRTAGHQTQGRGRHGRRWHGAQHGALLFSLALPWRRAVADSAAVTLACGLAVARALEPALATQGAMLRVKWPNDILLGTGKLGGLLVELAEDASGARTLVIGMGLNLATDATQLHCIAQERQDAALAAQPTDGAAPLAVAALADVLGPSVVAEADSWLARCVLALLAAARAFEHQGFAPQQPAFNDRCAYRGSAVQVRDARGSVILGRLDGVDDQGRLLLDVDGQPRSLSSGELSVRPQVPAPAGRAARAAAATP